MNSKVLEYYKKTSPYIDLGLYKNVAKKLPNSVEKLCLLQRKQMYIQLIC